MKDKSKTNLNKALGITLLFLLVLIIGLFIYDYFRIKPNNVQFTNITSNSVTVSWDTKTKTSATAIYKEGDSKFPFSILSFKKQEFFDTRDITKAELENAEKSFQQQEGLEITMNDIVTEVKVDKRGKYYTHHIEITGLAPKTEYSFMVGDSILFRKVEDINNNTVAKTYAVPETILTPNPAYGTVLNANNKEVSVDKLQKVNDAIVYFNYYDKSSGAKSNVFSAPLNKSGNWYIDVSNAIDEFGKNFLETYDSIDENLSVDLYINAGPDGLWKKNESAYSFSPTSLTVLNMKDGVQDETIKGSIIQVDSMSKKDEEDVKGELIAIACTCPDSCPCSGEYPLKTCTSGNCSNTHVTCYPTDSCGNSNNCAKTFSKCYKNNSSCSCDVCGDDFPLTKCPDGESCYSSSRACTPSGCGSVSCYKVIGNPDDECTGCSCTPKCPDNYTAIKPSGEYESKEVSCIKVDSCGKNCNGGKTYRTCYKAKQNTGATKVACSFPVYCPATINDCVWKWSDNSYHDSCKCDEATMKARNCSSVVDPEKITCAGEAKLGQCTWSTGEGRCKRCEEYAYSSNSLDGKWKFVDDALCGTNKTQIPFNCSNSNPVNCNLGCSKVDKYVKVTLKLPFGMDCNNETQVRLHGYDKKYLKDCSCTSGINTSNYKQYADECVTPGLKTCSACSTTNKYKKETWTAKDCNNSTEKSKAEIKKTRDCTCTKGTSVDPIDASYCDNSPKSETKCSKCSSEYKYTSESWTAPAGVSCEQAYASAQIPKVKSMSCISCSNSGSKDYSNYSIQCKNVGSNLCWVSDFNYLYKCDANDCYECTSGKWVKIDENSSCPSCPNDCNDLINKGIKECSTIGKICTNGDSAWKCKSRTWIKLSDEEAHKIMADGTDKINSGEKCLYGTCECLSGVDKGKYIHYGKSCRDVIGTDGCVKIKDDTKVCSRSGTKCIYYREMPIDKYVWLCKEPEDASIFKEVGKHISLLNRFSFLSEVYAEDINKDNYIIDQSTGLISGLEEGVYSFENNGQTYFFDISEESLIANNGNVFIFIDKNDNGEYDEGTDTKISTLGAQIQITTIQKSYKYSLKEGFNFVSFPFVVAYDEYRTAASLLKQLNSVYGDIIYSISKFDGSWKVVGQNLELYDNNDFQLLPGQGYVIKAKEDINIVIPGKPIKYESSEETAPIYLSQGWNLIGIYGTNVKSYTAKSMLQDINNFNNIDFTANNVTKWESDTQRYEGYQLNITDGVEKEYGFDYPIDILKSYFVRVENGTGNWQPELESK